MSKVRVNHKFMPLLTQCWSEGRLLRGAGAYGITIEDLLGRANHPPEDVVETADFWSRALVLDPTQRWSAKQLLQHPWLDNTQ